jgi:hypothetical protein
MVHAREDYNRIQDPENKIPEDEPVFLLRGQDKLAAEVVRYWARLAENEGLYDIAEMAYRQAGKMAAWPDRKLPDLPDEWVAPWL